MSQSSDTDNREARLQFSNCDDASDEPGADPHQHRLDRRPLSRQPVALRHPRCATSPARTSHADRLVEEFPVDEVVEEGDVEGTASVQRDQPGSRQIRHSRLAQEELGFATRRDAVLAISFTPYASETVALAQAAAARNVPIVAITDSGFSPLAFLAETRFDVAEANFEGIRSMAAILALAMTLTVALAEMRVQGGDPVYRPETVFGFHGFGEPRLDPPRLVGVGGPERRFLIRIQRPNSRPIAPS